MYLYPWSACVHTWIDKLVARCISQCTTKIHDHTVPLLCTNLINIDCPPLVCCHCSITVLYNCSCFLSGTFGQRVKWMIEDPSTYQHSLTSSDSSIGVSPTAQETQVNISHILEYYVHDTKEHVIIVRTHSDVLDLDVIGIQNKKYCTMSPINNVRACIAATYTLVLTLLQTQQQ